MRVLVTFGYMTDKIFVLITRASMNVGVGVLFNHAKIHATCPIT